MFPLKELDYQQTPLGELVLRRRRSPSVPDDWVYEVKLNDEMLMSSSVNVSERALAELAMEALGERPCDVLIGGLGLGCTAAAALERAHVRRVVVVELLAPVIAWHRNRLVPLAEQLTNDPRCVLVEGDFFAHVGPASSDPRTRYDAILVDIDHSPEFLLHPSHGDFYTLAGLRALAECLESEGVFGLWSASQLSAELLERLGEVFATVGTHEVSFYNPHVDEMDSNWIIVAKRP